MHLIRDGQQIQFKVIATFLIIFGAYVNYLVHYQNDDPCAH